jgi:hypothetical protein
VNRLKEALVAEFGATSLSGIYLRDPPIRGPFGEAEIRLKKDAVPTSIPPYQMTGERRDALDSLVGKYIDQGKLESGMGPWNTPAFPVPKKVPHTFRLVQDLRPQNAATEKDGHPLPRIGDMVQRQGNNRVWTVLDLVDGFHQMPLKKEHRYITCMSTPRGTQQWTVLVMGLKNAGIQFQRMMEWVLRDLPASDPYLDDIITGSAGPDRIAQIWSNYYDVRALLKTYEDEKLVCKWEKSHFFETRIEFCGHILEDGKRSPAPGKLLPIQLWELPKTVTDLRGFLGLTNYFSEYVEHYAETAAPLMGKLQLNRHDGRKGSKLRLVWTADETLAFERLKEKLCKNLVLWQANPDAPFRLHCDASDYAIGAELTQKFGDVWRPVAFYSRKLAKSQCNWAPREKETYAIVASLRKWSGLIGFQPTLVTTDHRSIEEWVTEHVDTPSGPRGRRARWHETLSQFDLEIKYIPGPENVIPDALSRWAYPASSAREDVSFHGSLEAKKEVQEMIEKEYELSRLVGLVRLKSPTKGVMLVGGTLPENATIATRVHVVTRSALDTENEEENPDEDFPPDGEAVEVVSGLDEAEATDGGGWLRSSRRRKGKGPWGEMPGGLGKGTSPGGPLPPLPPLSSQVSEGGASPGDGGGAGAGPAIEPGQHDAQPESPVCPFPPMAPILVGVGTPSTHEVVGTGPGELQTPSCPPEEIASSSSSPHVDLGFRFAIPGQPRPANPGRKRQKKALSPLALDGDVGGDGDFDLDSIPDLNSGPIPDSVPLAVGKKFQFAEPPPGAVPGGVSRIPPGRVSRGPASRVASDPKTTPEMRAPSQILDQDWSLDYETSPAFTDQWVMVAHGLGDWPEGYKVFNGKLYFQERLCVPENLVQDVLRIHHEWVAHVGNDRLLPEVCRRYHFPPDVDVKALLQKIRHLCLVCQACDRPTFSRRRPIAMTPIPDRFFSSVCLDVFSMPTVEWQGQKFDAFLMCVDRHSGWMVARPTLHLGLTGEKAAHLLLDNAWGEVGIPSIITTDLGAQFVGAWWRCICSRLGIRVAYSQAHHHQANGRAEVAGRVVQDVLRKLLVDRDQNWVEALPRALRILHDMVNPVTKLAPYEIVFGRERALAGLPLGQKKECLDADSYHEKMKDIDENVARLLNEEHAKVADRVNANRSESDAFQVGDWVWYIRPRSITGPKLQTWWLGPYKVMLRVGERSYRLRTPQGEELDAYQNQLKPCFWTQPGELKARLYYPARSEDDDEGTSSPSLAPSPRSEDGGVEDGAALAPDASPAPSRTEVVQQALAEGMSP